MSEHQIIFNSNCENDFFFAQMCVTVNMQSCIGLIYDQYRWHCRNGNICQWMDNENLTKLHSIKNQWGISKQFYSSFFCLYVFVNPGCIVKIDYFGEKIKTPTTFDSSPRNQGLRELSILKNIMINCTYLVG